ncbi:MAG: citrate synthase [Eubacterium sp.]|nr:citrate synthase [Eubacterium sp.]
MDKEKITFNEINSQITDLSEKIKTADKINEDKYSEKGVYRGLRNLDGEGLLVGLTGISEISARKESDGKLVPTEGRLFYRGYDINEIIKGIPLDSHFGFEECTYLLMFGELPNKNELHEFVELLAKFRKLPNTFVRDTILKAPSPDMMVTLSRSILTLYSYDEKADDTSLSNVLRQCLYLISVFPLLSVYGYVGYRHFYEDKTLYIHNPDPKLSTSENILKILRPDSTYTPLEAKLLDMLLILHMEHGGGNNSTFTTHLVTTTGTDTYSCIAAALGSLKGPNHGGATRKIVDMMRDIRDHVSDSKDEDEIAAYLKKILNGEAYDRTGNIYGIGHAVYSVSDPRNEMIRRFVEMLSHEKGLEEEFRFYNTVERLAPKVISENRKMYKGVSANLEFYSGFVYTMLKIPEELFTPMFAVARIAGWSAHRLEELCSATKIIRPAYSHTTPRREFVPMDKR